MLKKQKWNKVYSIHGYGMLRNVDSSDKLECVTSMDFFQ